jgi:hypothetical protein
VPDLVTDVIGSDTAGMGPDPVFMGVLQTYANEHPDTFAGIWIDREASGTVVLAFTDDPVGHRDALAARRPSPYDAQPIQPPATITDDRPIGEWDLTFDVVRAAHPQADLAAVAEAVLPALVDAGRTDFGVATNPIENRVVLLPGGPITADDVAEIAAVLAPVVPVGMVCLDGEIVDAPPPTVAPGTLLDVIALPGADGSYPADTPVECGGIGFELGAVLSPTPVAEVDPALAEVVAAVVDGPMGEFVPEGEWLLLAQDGSTATLGLVADGALTYAFAELGRNGWTWTGGGSGGPCVVRRRLPAGLGGVDWVLDPDAPPPGPDATELRVLATETACTGGSEPGERLLGPQVVETDDAVRIAFATIPLTGEQACPGNPPTRVIVTLTAPLGQRAILDGLAIAPLADLLNA